MRRRVSNGYIEVYAPDHPNAHPSTGFVYEHRYVMSQKLGRPLLRSELVHHDNEDKRNNVDENLKLKESIAEHKVSHRKKDAGLRLPGEGNPLILCKCGCGTRLLKYDESGRPREYAPYHSWRKGKLSYDPTETIDCTCGCGTRITKYDSSGRKRLFVSGHNRKKNIFDPTEMITCVCGCGKKRPKYDVHGKVRLFMPGHRRRTT